MEPHAHSRVQTVRSAPTHSDVPVTKDTRTDGANTSSSMPTQVRAQFPKVHRTGRTLESVTKMRMSVPAIHAKMRRSAKTWWARMHAYANVAMQTAYATTTSSASMLRLALDNRMEIVMWMSMNVRANHVQMGPRAQIRMSTPK